MANGLQGDQLARPGAVKVFRSQLPRHNPYYSSEPPTRLDRLPQPLEVRALGGAQTHMLPACADRTLKP